MNYIHFYHEIYFVHLIPFGAPVVLTKFSIDRSTCRDICSEIDCIISYIYFSSNKYMVALVYFYIS